MARSNPVNVLIVDPDRAHQRTIADALVRQGYVVTVERDGEWAIKTLEKKSFDAVIIDPTLPSVHGFEVISQLRELNGAKTSVIFMSSLHPDPAQRRAAMEEYGAVGFLEKPVDVAKLTSGLKKALGRKRPKPSAPKPPPPPVEEDEATGEFLADDTQREEVTAVETQSRTAVPGPGLRGDFESRSFAEVLAEIYRWRASGALLLRRQNVKKIVYFRNGTPESVKSNLLVECLGKILVREKMISEAECEESLKRMKQTKRMQGTVLIDMGCLSPHNLQYALVLQLQEKLYDAFRWDNGEYQFNPAVELPAEPLSLGMTTAQLILEGVRRSYEGKRLARALGDVDELYAHHSDEPLYALQDAGLRDEEAELLRMIDGHQTVSTLRALNVLSRVDTDRLLFAMRCAQMVQLKDAPAPGKRRPSIAKLAVDVAKPPPLPPPMPTQGPVMPPPLPPRTSVAGLPLPWDNAELAKPMAPPPMGPPPPPVDITPPHAPSRRPPPPVEAPRPTLGGSLLPELSAVMSMPKLSNEDTAAREKLAAKMAAMRKQDYFELLGVRPNASREDIKRAYFMLAKEFHPDRHYSSTSAEVRALAQQLYELISTAHDTLTDPDERARYVKELSQGAKREMDGDVSRILAAEGKFQRGETLMRQRSYAEAHKAFTEAVGLYPDEGEFHAWYGWSLFQVDPERAGDAIGAIEKAISLNPKMDKGYLFLGYIHKATERPDKAEKQFEKAIQCNPDCTEALRELRLLGRHKR